MSLVQTQLHANRVAEEKRLIQTLARVNERGGKVLIPAFALGRSQELVKIIHAFADQVTVPVYVDGMVRSVCEAYTRFTDLLPEATVRAAGEEHLFFRGRVKPVKSAEQRSQIAMGTEPCVIIASSGMLTGGASAFYAKHLAPDERNAIFLTGYQDEESPGRVLQRWMRDIEKGEIPTLKLGKDEVKLRCEVDTYSLSAHADESELVSIAEAFGEQDIMLVHGDEGARHSLATGLRPGSFRGSPLLPPSSSSWSSGTRFALYCRPRITNPSSGDSREVLKSRRQKPLPKPCSFSLTAEPALS